MEKKYSNITSAIVLALLFTGIMAQTIGNARFQPQPQSITQVPPAPLNLQVKITASGATFPAPLIGQYITNYQAAHPNVTISYLGGGSGRGQRDMINKTVDFAASDAPLNAGQRILTPNVLHVPETIGSVVPAYNVPGLPGGLHLNGSSIASIFLGDILNWNDPAIQQQNPGVALPAQAIKVAHRSDSSGTTFIWTSFLCLDSTKWCTSVGSGTAVNWPVGTGAAGNGGVANYITANQYAFGYVELNYALANLMTYAAVKNPAGNYILANETTTANAVNDGAGNLPRGSGDWSSVSLLNEPGAKDYPIASFSYFLVYKELNVVPSMDLVDKIQAKYVIDFLKYAITTGQGFASGLSYVPLPAAVVANSLNSINSITFTDVSSPASQTVNLSVGPSGWSQTSLTVTTGDTITLNLLSADGTSHQWYIDFNNNGILDANESATTLSPVFSSTTTPTPFTFTPVIWSQEGIPAAGTYTFRDANNPSLTGTIVVRPQQTPAVFLANSSLSSTLAQVLDSSRVSTIGSAIIDQRTQIVSGNITVAAVDKTSGAITFVKSYILPNLPLFTSQGFNPRAKAELNIAVLPYALASDLLIELQGNTATASADPLRQPDIAGNGKVSIIDVSYVFFRFGTSIGVGNYDPAADLDGNGLINLIDASIIAARFGTIVLR